MLFSGQKRTGKREKLTEIGIEAPLGVCFGEQTLLGFEVKSFVITEEVPGQSFPDFASRGWSLLAQSEKEADLRSTKIYFQNIQAAQAKRLLEFYPYRSCDFTTLSA